MSRNRRRKPSLSSVVFTMILFDISAFGVLILNSDAFDPLALIAMAATVLLLIFQYFILSVFFPNCDRTVLVIANFLVSVGLVIQFRISPSVAMKQLVWIVMGMVCMIVTTLAIRRSKIWPNLWRILIVLSGVFLASAVVLGSEKFGASNWINIGIFSFQPSEFVKIMLIFVLAALLGRERNMKTMIIAAGYVGACLLLLLLQEDLGAALLYAGTAMIMLYIATGNKLLLAGSAAGGAAGAVVAYKMFSHVRVRVALWKNPWAMYEKQGYQVVQGLIAIASGGLFGLGLMQSMPKSIPAAHTDYIFAVICAEFGVLFGLALLAFYLIFIIRGAIIAMDCRNSFDAMVAIGCVSMLALQSFIIIGGVTKLIPLTGITLPFVSYGGSSILSCFFILGILEGLAVKNGDADEVEFAEWNEEQDEWEEKNGWETEDEAYDDAYDEDEYDEYEEDPYDDDRAYYQEDEAQPFASRRNREPEPLTRRQAKKQAKQAKAEAKQAYKQAKRQANEQAKRKNRRAGR
ncbi:MAG: FtsW/RodA/SpoVE family cell cycle protein [Christensenellales bacterium]